MQKFKGSECLLLKFVRMLRVWTWTTEVTTYPAGISGRSLKPIMAMIPWTSGSGPQAWLQLKSVLVKIDHSAKCRFIKWTQDTFKTGGHQAELLPLLERCTRELQDRLQYKSDIRYLRVWIQYVSHCRSKAPDKCTGQSHSPPLLLECSACRLTASLSPEMSLDS